MEVSNEKLINSIEVLNNLSQQQLPIAISYVISKNINKIENELKIYNKEREKLIEKYSIKDEKGEIKVNKNGSINIQEEYSKEWIADNKELLAMENEIEIEQIQIAKFENTNFNIAPADLGNIDYMIIE